MSEKTIHEVPAIYLVAAVLQNDTVLAQVQRDIFRFLPGISIDQLRQILRDEVLRPDVVDGPEAKQAQLMLDRVKQLQSKGLSMTGALKVVTSPTKTSEDDEDDAFIILTDDKRNATSGG